MNFFQIQLLYYVSATILAFIGFAYVTRALFAAAGKRLRSFLVWLVPIFVSNVISLPGLLIQDAHFFAGRRPTLSTYELLYALPILGGCISLFGLSRLLKVIQDVPVAPGEAPPDPAPNPPGAWPPPPSRG